MAECEDMLGVEGLRKRHAQEWKLLSVQDQNKARPARLPMVLVSYIWRGSRGHQRGTGTALIWIAVHIGISGVRLISDLIIQKGYI